MRKIAIRTLRVAVLLICLFLIPAVVQAETLKLNAEYSKFDQFIVIRKSTNQLHYYEKGELLQTFPVNEKSIGKYVSSGCIRMHNKDVRRLYSVIRVGTPVLITP